MTKWVGKNRETMVSPPLPPGPKNTSSIQMNRIATAPLTGLGTATAIRAPIAR
ncbi:hypothetical protein M2432_001688 [Mycobacterium sp. OTB74]|nr:hypothetical protein [Mycobacterium sp. OTB74]